HIPVALSVDVVVYNVPNVPTNLKLNQQVLARIYKGEIENWNEKGNVALNPGVTLPQNNKTVVCYRNDESKTTMAFDDYLRQGDGNWKSPLAPGLIPTWPLGVGADSDGAMVGLVRKNLGAIGYVDFSTAAINKLSMAELKNAKGQYVT